jgi:hypothetical protein
MTTLEVLETLPFDAEVRMSVSQLKDLFHEIKQLKDEKATLEYKVTKLEDKNEDV